ncbi:hypothetical protein AAX09_00035 [Moraxella bovoculi]|nr:hypothetical protein AAX09_00035 [Moraxella bovoculi]
MNLLMSFGYVINSDYVMIDDWGEKEIAKLHMVNKKGVMMLFTTPPTETIRISLFIKWRQ